LGNDSQRIERSFYIAKTVEIDGYHGSFDGFETMNDAYFFAKWAHFTRAAENDADRIFSTVELRQIAAAFSEGEQAQKQCVFYRLRWLLEGSHGLSELAIFASQRSVRRIGQGPSTTVALLAAPENADEYWAAFYASDRLDSSGRLVANPERVKRKELDDGLSITVEWPKELFFEEVPTGLLPESALLIELLYNRMYMRGGMQVTRSQLLETLRSEDPTLIHTESSLSEVFKDVRIFLKNKGLSYLWE
jgi:hypothetical protein